MSQAAHTGMIISFARFHLTYKNQIIIISNRGV
jgi:hypothetical protein